MWTHTQKRLLDKAASITASQLCLTQPSEGPCDARLAGWVRPGGFLEVSSLHCDGAAPL